MDYQGRKVAWDLWVLWALLVLLVLQEEMGPRDLQVYLGSRVSLGYLENLARKE